MSEASTKQLIEQATQSALVAIGYSTSQARTGSERLAIMAGTISSLNSLLADEVVKLDPRFGNRKEALRAMLGTLLERG